MGPKWMWHVRHIVNFQWNEIWQDAPGHVWWLCPQWQDSSHICHFLDAILESGTALAALMDSQQLLPANVRMGMLKPGKVSEWHVRRHIDGGGQTGFRSSACWLWVCLHYWVEQFTYFFFFFFLTFKISDTFFFPCFFPSDKQFVSREGFRHQLLSQNIYSGCF